MCTGAVADAGEKSSPAGPTGALLWRFAFPAIVVAAGLAVLLLAREGGRAVLDKRVDTVQETVVLQPDEPGYLELVGVTPTLLSLHTHDGELTGVAFIARTGVDAGGGVVLLPADLQVAPGVGYVRRGELISEVFARGGADAVEQVAEGLFGLGFDDVEEITTESLAHSMGPAAPVPYLLVDDLSEAGPDGGQRVVYEAGTHELSAADAAAVYAFRNADEADVNRVQRQRALWESWLGVIGRADDPAAAAPPPSSVLSAFMRALGSGTAVVEVPLCTRCLTPPCPLAPNSATTANPGCATGPWSWCRGPGSRSRSCGPGSNCSTARATRRSGTRSLTMWSRPAGSSP